jgi:sporulation protein YlmC with PRC-barrel domain
MKFNRLIAALSMAALASVPTWGSAQVAGSTTLGVSAIEITQITAGWSVKKSILGKTVYNDTGEKIGKVEDLILSPDNSVSYAIVGAGGFIGIGRHDVAIPMGQLHDQGGRIVMPGATKGIVKTMPAFHYADTTADREAFIAAAEGDIASAKTKLAQLKDKTASASADVKAQISMQATTLRLDLASAEEKLAILKSATKARWKEFQADVTEATQRLRKSLSAATA